MKAGQCWGPCNGSHRVGRCFWEPLGLIPASVVGWGSKDRLLFPRQWRRLHEALPAAEVYTLPGLGHVPMGDDPRMVADLVRYAVSR